LPPAVVHVRASTREARSWTGLAMTLAFLEPAGRLPFAMGRWQSVTRPARVTEQVLPGFPAVNGLALAPDPLTAALGFGDALALGCGDALALGCGVVLAWASPASMRVLAAVITIRVSQRPMLGRLFHFNVGPPRQIRIAVVTRCRGRWPYVLSAMTTMSTTFIAMLIHRYLCVKV
jgi:hypothetical protein